MQKADYEKGASLARDKYGYHAPVTAVSRLWKLASGVAIINENTALGIDGETAVSPAVDFNQPLGALINAAVLAATDSENTQRAYKTSLGQFFSYLGEALGAARPLAEPTQNGAATLWAFRGTAVVVTHILPSHLDGFRTWLNGRQLSTNATESRYAAVKTFLAVCLRDGYLSEGQARRLDIRPFKRRVSRDVKPVGRRLTKSEVKQLRTAVPSSTLKGKRDRAIIDCMLFAGLRRDEVTQLKVSSLQPDSGCHWLIVKGKGKKTRRIKVATSLYKSLVNWIDGAGKTLAHELPIFEGVNRHDKKTGAAVDGSTIGRIVNQYGAAAGLAPASGDNMLSPHDLRRTAARNAYDNGASLLVIQKFLGHKDPKTTAHYIGLNEDDDNTAVDYIRY